MGAVCSTAARHREQAACTWDAGSWSAVSGFHETTQTDAALALIFLGDEATLTMGTGPDHGMYDVYLDGSLWQSFDGYASATGSRAIVISSGIDSRKLGGEGPHLLEIRNRIERNKQNVTAPPVYKLRFQQLTVSSRTWTQQTIRYSYDRLARLTLPQFGGHPNCPLD